MKKWMLILLALFMALSCVACAADETDSVISSSVVDVPDIDSGVSVDDADNTSQQTTAFTFSPQTTGASYSCTVTWNSSGPVYGHTDKIVVRDEETQREVQIITPEENEMSLSSQDLLYFMDVTFDGYNDMLIPTSYSARYRAFMVYRWENTQKQFVRVPTLLLEPAVDADEKVIRTYTAGSQVASYSVYKYDDTSGDYVCTHSLFFEPVDVLAEDSLMRLVVEEEGEKQEFTVSGEAYQLDVNDPIAAPYYADDSLWDLDSDKWNMTACFWR